MRIAIYALCDPRTGCVRYIGKAVDPQKRLKSHLRDAHRRNTPVAAWIRKLGKLNLTPLINVLRWVDETDWMAAEIAEIAQRRADPVSRAALLNLATGGNQPHVTAEQRMQRGAEMNARLASDKRLMRLRLLKAKLMSAANKGIMPQHVREKLLLAAAKNPAMLGCFLHI